MDRIRIVGGRPLNGSIPISGATESLNAGIAASVALYQVATLRAQGTD